MRKPAAGMAGQLDARPPGERTSNAALNILGVFHIVCLGLVMSMPELRTVSFFLRYSVDLSLNWWTSLIIANAVVAVGITLPLSRRKPAGDWRSLWFVWLYVAYLLLAALWSGLVIRQLRFSPIPVDLMPFRYLPLKLSGYELPIAAGAFLLLGLVCGIAGLSRLKVPGAGWKMWLTVCVLSIGTRWNHELVLVPVALLTCFGFYVAFSALGRKWILRALPSILFFCALTCIASTWFFVRDLWNPLRMPRELYDPGILGLIMWHRNVFGGHEVWTSTWLLTFVPLSVGLALPYARLRQRVPGSQLLLHLVILIQMVTLLFVFRRSAMWALMVMVPVALVVAGRIKLRRVLMVGVPALLIFIVLGVTGILPDRVFYFMTNDSGHRGSIKAGMDMFVKNPAWGVGPGRFGEDALQWSADHSFDINWAPIPLNDYVWVLTETGAVGLVFWLAAGLQILSTLRRLSVVDESPTIRIVLAAFIVQIVTNALTMAFLIATFGRGGWFIPNAAFLSAILGAIWTDRKIDAARLGTPERAVGDPAEAVAAGRS